MPYVLDEKTARSVVTAIRAKIREYFEKNGLHYAVFGKSEGLDSSVIAGLLADIPGVQPIAAVIPIETAEHVVPLAYKVLKHYAIPSVEVDLTGQYRAIKTAYYNQGGLVEQLRGVAAAAQDSQTVARLESVEKLALGNIKVRLRMITLYHIAQLLGGLVVSTDNYSEYWMGFWTINGDVGDLVPIQQIFKGSELYTIGKVLGLPEEALNAVPSDGLGVTAANTDEAQLGLPYDKLDRVILRLLTNSFLGHAPADREAILDQISQELDFGRDVIAQTSRRLISTEFKRHWPVIFTREDLGLPPLELIQD